LKRSDPKSYYSAHRSEVLARAKHRREANPELYRERGRKAQRRWRDSHRDKHRAIRNAQQTVPLGDCCEFCGSKDDLMRFLPDYNYPKVVVTVCRDCRGWIRRQPAS